MYLIGIQRKKFEKIYRFGKIGDNVLWTPHPKITKTPKSGIFRKKIKKQKNSKFKEKYYQTNAKNQN